MCLCCGSNFIFLCCKLIIIPYHTQNRRKIKFESRMTLNHNISEYLYFSMLCVCLIIMTLFAHFFSQKLDDARFGIQPVDDDDGTFIISVFYCFRHKLRLSPHENSKRRNQRRFPLVRTGRPDRYISARTEFRC